MNLTNISIEQFVAIQPLMKQIKQLEIQLEESEKHMGENWLDNKQNIDFNAHTNLNMVYEQKCIEVISQLYEVSPDKVDLETDYPKLVKFLNKVLEGDKIPNEIKFNEVVYELVDVPNMPLVLFNTLMKLTNGYSYTEGKNIVSVPGFVLKDSNDFNLEYLAYYLGHLLFKKGFKMEKLVEGNPPNYFDVLEQKMQQLINEQIELFKKMPISLAITVVKFFFLNSNRLKRITSPKSSVLAKK